MRCCCLLLLALTFAFAGCHKPPPKVVLRLPLTIETVPPKATVRIDGVLAQVSEGGVLTSVLTPMEARLTEGKHWVQLELDGYETQYFPVTIKAPGPPPPINVTLERLTAGLRLESEPSNASAKLDGKDLGKTPCALPAVPLGLHTLTLSLAGHADQEKPFEIKDCRPVHLRYDLVSLLASIKVTSNPPGARVALDGDDKGATPNDGTAPITIRDIVEGEHVVTLRKTNYEDVTFHFVLMRGETKIIQPPAMKPLPGGVIITSVPTGAKVTLDGDAIGKTPFTMTGKTPGTTLTFVLSQPGYADTSASVVISPGINKQLDLTLGKESATLTLVTEPAACDVFLDGKKIGATERGDTAGVSKAFQYEPIEPGPHVLTLSAPAFQRKSVALTLVKGELKSLHVSLDERWLPTHRLILKGGKTLDGKLIRTTPDGAIDWSPSKGMQIQYKKDEIESLTPL